MVNLCVDSYLAVRRAAGFALVDDEPYLRSFARFADEREDTHVRAETAVAWAALGRSSSQRGHRLDVVRRLARHLQVEDSRHEVPPEGVFVWERRRRPPYIYSSVELHRLLEAALALSPEGSLRPKTYWTLFALLASTGLRVGEALSLTRDDFTADGLVIRFSKFNKTRLVPLHPTARVGLSRYLDERNKAPGNDDHLFVTHRGRPLAYTTVNATFLELARSIGLHPGPGKKGPRLHDLRHRFAVRALLKCPHRRDQVGRHMLALSTYLGHTRLADTYWYLSATPELMTDISAAAEAFVRGGAR